MSSETLDERFHADLAAYAKANPDSLDDDGNLLPPSQDEFSLEWAWKQLRKAESELSRLQQENERLTSTLRIRCELHDECMLALQSAERELKALQQERDALRVENAQAWGEAADVGGELAELRGELKALQNKWGERLDRVVAALEPERWLTKTDDEAVNEVVVKIGELKALREQMRWVPVEEKLPEAGVEVLAGAFITGKFADGRVTRNWQHTLMVWTGSRWIDSDSGEEDCATHWRALGPGPEGGR